MESIQLLPLAVALIIMVALTPNVTGQSNNSNSNTNTNTNALCTGPMIRSFGSCVGYLAGGSAASSPTTACCNSLRDLMSNGQDCLCLMVTGGVPFQVPINQNLAIALPKACKQSGVPIECKDPTENPDPNAPSTYPGFSPSLPIPQVPFNPQPFTPPPSGGRTTRPESPGGDLVPTLTPPGMRPTLISAAHPLLPSLLMALITVFLFIFH